jgi:uncharacterized repeat protein (TIGR01451 family)
MKVFKNTWSKAKKTFAAGVATAVVTAVATLGFGVATVTVQASPSNDIMPGGASSPSAFIKKLKANKPSDMNNVYAAYGLPSSQYDEFQKYAKKGQINPNNGNITVSGDTVGKDGLSLGRNSKGSISKAVKIDGKTYYQSHIKDLTKYFNDAMVLFDSKGNVQTVVMNLCGNPIKVTPNNPKYECKMLNVKQGSDNFTFNFSSSVSASNGATVTKVVYDFGDGNTQTEKSPSTVVTHKYAKAGSYTATVTAYVKTTFGRGEFPITVTSDCKKVVTVKEVEKPGIQITKTVDGVDNKEVALNTPFTYQLVVKNTGNVDLKDALVSDPAPANVVFLSTDKGTITHNTLSYTIPTLKVGASETINITAKLTAYVAGDIVNKACVDTPTIPGSPDACDTTTITTPKPSIKIEKLVNGKDRDQVAVGQTFTYTVKVTNDGKADLTNAVVTDPAPANVQFLTTDKGTITNNTLSYTIPTFKAGASELITLTAKVTAYVAGDIVNKACVDTPTIPGAPDACDTTTVTVKKPNVTIEKLVNGQKRDVVEVGEVFTYTVKVTNNGEVDLVNALVTDPAPQGVTMLTTNKGTITNNALTYTIPKLAVGASDTITITAKVAEYKSGDIINTACVNAVEVNPSQPDVKDACDNATVTVNKPKVPGVKIEKLVNGQDSVQVAVGETFTYTVKVTNSGEVDLTNAVVTDPAPANVQFLTTDKGTITNNVLSYTIPSLKVGESTVITMTAKVTAQVDGNIKNTACVDAVEVPGDKDACDDAYVHVPPVVPTNPNITITKTVNDKDETVVAVGEVFTYKLVVKNTGDIDLTNVLVSDPAPEGVTLLGADTGSIVGNKWTYTIPSLKAGESQTFTITAKVATYHAGAMINTACVNAPEVNPSNPDKDDACDTATVTVPTPETPTTPETPEVLPNTGAGNVIGLFFGTVVAAGLFHYFVIGRRKVSQE